MKEGEQLQQFAPVASSSPNPRIRLAHPDVGPEELDAIARTLGSGVLTNGPETAAFEREFAEYHQVEHGVAFANGTLALMAMFVGLGIGPGDDVIVPSLTFISSATSARLVGATPVFADVDPETFNLDPSDVSRRVTSRTKAVLAVHYGGQAADLSELGAIADDAGAVLLEDAAEAHGATYRGKAVGGWGRAAMFSFTPTKNITTGEGGMVITDDGNLAAQLRLLRNHGQSSLYRHEILGWNMRITEMQAAMGRVQVRKLPAILSRKRRLASDLGRLLAAIPGVETPVVRADRDHVYMLYTVKLENDRDAVLKAMLGQGIEVRVYFPPVHLQPIFARSGARLPVTENLCARILSLPVHSHLTAAETEQIVHALSTAVGEAR
jgi:perosamine synthetase